MAIVLWSGGLDSTLVLHNLAMQISRKEREHQSITALSISHDQVPAREILKTAREKIKKVFEERELNSYINYIEVSISHSNNSGVEVYGGVTQPAVWLTTASLYCKEKDTIFMGYHAGDDYWRYRHEAETAVINFLKTMDKNNVTLDYPLSLYYKSDIIKMLKNKGLYDVCWYCENPITGDIPKPCGSCPPCKCHRTALLQIENKLDSNPTCDNVVVSDKKIDNSIKELEKTVQSIETLKAPEVKGS
jgi:7-cyano-7-deazaguanine synthase in queuosine biosynthesis